MIERTPLANLDYLAHVRQSSMCQLCHNSETFGSERYCDGCKEEHREDEP